MLKKILLILPILSGCATDMENLKVTPGKALLIAYNDNIAKVFLLVATTSNTRIEKIDGIQVSNFKKSIKKIELDPGKHTVEVSCDVSMGPATSYGKKVFEISFEADTRYLFLGRYNRPTCDIEYGTKKLGADHSSL